MKRSITTLVTLCLFTLGALLLASTGWCEDLGRNFALEAVSAIDDMDRDLLKYVGGDQSVTDGAIDTDWISRTAAVVGKGIEIDLGREVAVRRVRILAGTFLEERERPDFYIKGYRISVAPADDPTNWRAVAEQPANLNRDVDTTVDGTWLETDGAGNPLPTIGQYVRTEMITEDGNWVVIGEIEVYGQEVDGLSGKMLSTSVESASWGKIKSMLK